ncbi:unnamed protein product [Rotaria socialis]|uniref:Uncharacterized protein n=2 Tax=Rotaria socialis TaxID=392032 RepID=A0A818D809_9BILA|nr:unnamed protein product [Rotaria socialis]CAF4264449.1 unnamed protein product [Rotaria socialis]
MAECSWIVWQIGLELRYYDCCLLRINQINLPSLMSHFNTILGDRYPEMGTRFVQNSKGDYLVNRFIPCYRCLHENDQSEKYICQTFWSEALMIFIEKQMEIMCEKHGEISLRLIAPDLLR